MLSWGISCPCYPIWLVRSDLVVRCSGWRHEFLRGCHLKVSKTYLAAPYRTMWPRGWRQSRPFKNVVFPNWDSSQYYQITAPHQHNTAPRHTTHHIPHTTHHTTSPHRTSPHRTTPHQQQPQRILTLNIPTPSNTTLTFLSLVMRLTSSTKSWVV